MDGKNALWVPGTDHASIATEARVVNKLSEQGIKKTDLSREEFMTHAWEWKEKHGGIILEQLKKLGASCDWDRTAFTMDKERSKAVIRLSWLSGITAHMSFKKEMTGLQWHGLLPENILV